jgi:acyl phosphate:glycerol-3-phosphate acyltransferase
METILLSILITAAFGLGACPFSVWTGRWLMNKDVRNYGDGNPGAWNVFRAGGRKAGWLALGLDVGKGIPIILVAITFFSLSITALFLIGLSSILGHTFSPFLRFRGGKAVAVTYGVLIALPQREIFLLMAIFMFLAFLIIEVRSWIIMLGPLGSIAYLVITGITSVELFFLLSVLLIFAIKNYPELKTFPGHKGMLLHWVQAIKR